jgi:hypothetical protein
MTEIEAVGDEKRLDLKNVLKLFRVDQKKLAWVPNIRNIPDEFTYKKAGKRTNIRYCGVLWKTRWPNRINKHDWRW